MGENIVGKNIRKYRLLRGYTKRELAERAKLAHVTIVKYEKGERNASSYSLYKLSRALDVCISDLVKQKYILNSKGGGNMDFKRIAQYLFFYNHTVSPSIDIEEDIVDLYEYMLEFENSDFEYWLKDNDLEKAYEEFIKDI